MFTNLTSLQIIVSFTSNRFFGKTIYIIDNIVWFNDDWSQCTSEEEILIKYDRSKIRIIRHKKFYLVMKKHPSLHRRRASKAIGLRANSTIPSLREFPLSSTKTWAFSICHNTNRIRLRTKHFFWMQMNSIQQKGRSVTFYLISKGQNQ